MFADIIKSERIKKNLSQRELGDIIGVTQQAVARWETSLSTPDADTLVRLANFFDTSTDYLLGRTNIRHQVEVIAAHRTDNPMNDLPPEAIERIEEFKELMRLKYKKKPTVD